MNSNFSRKILDNMFKRVDGMSWDLTSGKIGIQDGNGISTLEITPAVAATSSTPAAEASYAISVNPLDQFGISIPAFATKVKHEDIEIGDIVVGTSEILGWVIDKKDVALVLLDKKGMRKNYTPPKVQVLGQDGALVVKTLGGLTGEGFSGLQGNLLPLIMMSDSGLGGGSLEKLLPLMLFTQTQGGGTNALSSMMPMLMLTGALGGNDGGSSIDKLLPLMMMGGLGGAGAAGGALAGMLPLLLMKDGGLGNLGSFGSVTGNDTPTPALQKLGRRY